ncbi:hydroxylamine oxidoreductase [Pseudodesulfovibrio sp. JC047]|uniref:multiheme c-type cytochrome n=1 Tax=Pseudodesulfovibrio sp. JC047 TaxID=2683199 RepID=UPI0013D78733|nr:multiheme c-type cytochrome [Pseudodesulfovibrio sp. JC047]NDV20780.1 hydroxylamine oxidoreductase [Pseudodesulfovibrio sp. JC047]
MDRRLSFFLATIMTFSLVFVAAAGAQNFPKVREFRMDRVIPPQGTACIECHKQETPGIFADWAMSRHASAGITCLDCHQAESGDQDIAVDHEKYYSMKNMPMGEKQYFVPIASPVTPKDCSRCHPDEAKQYAKSKHANTIEIMWKLDPWLNKGMNSDNERKTGCYYCHGTVLKMKDGKLDPATWPNVGVGRLNLDGSLGSCTSCHTRHRFSVMEARKPETCGQCHLGPDHPQIEIFNESKHGDIYQAFKHEYNFKSAPGAWTPGVDYRAPTCSSCHMSGSGNQPTTHDVTERLSWELQAPLTVRPQDFKPFPSGTDWQVERAKMKDICKQCHGNAWIDDHYAQTDKAIEEYNENYFKPAKKVLDELYEKGLLDKSKYFDEGLEVEYYELWHHEGRRARMGSAMMAPDYAWWHGFYECKHRYNRFMEEARHLIETNTKAYRYPDFPNTGGDTTRPVEIFGKK